MLVGKLFAVSDAFKKLDNQIFLVVTLEFLKKSDINGLSEEK
jgi:hypothetical protein